MRYLDSGGREPASTLYAWLSDALGGSPSALRCQTGYFTADGLAPFEEPIRRMLEAQGRFRLVLGGNLCAATEADVNYLLDLSDQYSAAELRIIWPRSALLFHPKTFHVASDDRAVALVGSANWTWPALGSNVEAGIALEASSDQEAQVVDQVRAAIDAWFDVASEYSYKIARADIPVWRARGILVSTRKRVVGTKTEDQAGHRRGQPAKGMPLAVSVPRTPAARRKGQPRPSPAHQLDRDFQSPDGAVAVVKPLVKTDLRGINEQVGTWYLSLPKQLGERLPLDRPEPDKDKTVAIVVEARLASIPDAVVTSNDAPTNITFVGSAPARRSHPNLRMNLLTSVAKGLRGKAGEAGVALPTAGDIAVIELLDLRPIVARVTFVNRNDPGYSQLLSLTTSRPIGNSGAGWASKTDLDALPSW